LPGDDDLPPATTTPVQAAQSSVPSEFLERQRLEQENKELQTRLFERERERLVAERAELEAKLKAKQREVKAHA
jgi:ABC-type phosphate transport system auxiliary subunit